MPLGKENIILIVRGLYFAEKQLEINSYGLILFKTARDRARENNPIPGTGTEAANCSRFSAAAGSIPDTAAAAAAAAAVVVVVVAVIGGGATTEVAMEDVTAVEVAGMVFPMVVTAATDSGWVLAAATGALFRSGGLSIYR